MRRKIASLIALFALALPPVAYADEHPASPIVIQGRPRPYYLVVPPSTDPGSVPTAVLGTSVARGIVQHGEGEFLLLDAGEGADPVVLRMPSATNGFNPVFLSASSIPQGSYVEAVGFPSVNGVLDSFQVTIYLP